jgi:hypothetical protein
LNNYLEKLISIGTALLVLPLLAIFSVSTPIIQAYLSGLSAITIQIVLFSILGGLTGFILDRTEITDYILTGVLGSIMLGINKGLVYLQTLLLHQLSSTYNSTNSPMGESFSNSGILTEPEFSVYEVHIITAFTLLAYNLPILYYGYRNKAIEAKYLVFYLAPLTVYFLVPVVFNSVL